MHTTPRVTLRTANEEDREFAYAARKAAFEKYESQLHPWDEAAQRKLHDRRFDEHTYRIIEVGAQDTGVLMTESADAVIKLHQLFVLPEHQGQGVGRACMRLVLEEARALASPVRLRVLKVNPRARAFFGAFGFSPTAETATHTVMETPTAS